MMKYGAKKDANHKEIVQILQLNGAEVYDLSAAGNGIPDLLVWVKTSWQLVEVKNLKTSYGKRGLNHHQKRWIGQWKGGPVYILTDIHEAARFARGNFEGIKFIDSLWTAQHGIQ